MSAPPKSHPESPSEHAGGSINPELVRRVARLARLGLADAELAAAGRELASLLEHFRTLQGVPTEGVEPLAQAVDAPGLAADDRAAPSLDPRRSLLPLTVHAREGFFVVPRVLDDASPAGGG